MLTKEFGIITTFDIQLVRPAFPLSILLILDAGLPKDVSGRDAS